MCGRFAITLPNDAMAQLFGATPANDLPDIPNFNVCPTINAHVIANDGEQRRLSSMRWGFLPHWYKNPTDGPLLINARAETIADKPAFRTACRERRCLIPATGFYEWTKDADGKRLPWHIARHDNGLLAFAGVWQDWGSEGDKIRTCAIVTCAANAKMAQIHHRMPVIVEQKDWGLWLGEEGKGAARLMRAAGDDLLTFWRVDPAVNSNRATGMRLLDRIEA